MKDSFFNEDREFWNRLGDSLKNDSLSNPAPAPRCVQRRAPVLLWTGAALAVAALALLVVSRRGHEQSVPGQPAAQPVHASAADSVSILRADADAQRVTGQTFRDFHVKHYAPGQALGRDVLVRVDADAVNVRRSDGAETVVSLEEWNAAAAGALAAEVSYLAARFENGAMTPDEFERLSAIAATGHAPALKSLEVVARSDGPFREASRSMLSHGKELTVILKLAERVQSGPVELRKNALRSLAQLRTPLALQSLYRCVLDPDPDFSMFAVRQLIETAGEEQLPLLRELSVAAPTEQARECLALEIHRRLSVPTPETEDAHDSR